MHKDNKVIIFAPFWGQTGHVGNNRVERFVRWLSEDGFYVAIIRAGSIDRHVETAFGEEVTVRDPLGLYRDVTQSGQPAVTRKPSKLRRALSYWLLNPDPTVVWARLAASHPVVLEVARGALFILSSSPPESAHFGAWKLSHRLSIPHIVDMRDGWLDEPLKPLLRSSKLRRLREGAMESRILRDASVIQVTSDVWQELLCQRLPNISPKVTVLTNGYPLHFHARKKTSRKQGVLLMHTGRFLGSRLTQFPGLLLQPLLEEIRKGEKSGEVQLFGLLSEEEMAMIDHFKTSFAAHGWNIECCGNLPRSELLQRLPDADALLLLSASFAAIPSKLFEYIPTQNPLFVVTEKDSATWRICSKLPQATVITVDAQDDTAVPSDFLANLSSLASSPLLPSDFTDESLKFKFMNNCVFRVGGAK